MHGDPKNRLMKSFTLLMSSDGVIFVGVKSAVNSVFLGYLKELKLATTALFLVHLSAYFTGLYDGKEPELVEETEREIISSYKLMFLSYFISPVIRHLHENLSYFVNFSFQIFF